MTSWGVGDGGFQFDSLDLWRFLPLLHSQAPWNEIFTGEKSSKAKIFPTQFQIEAGLEAEEWEGGRSGRWKVGLLGRGLSRTRNEGHSPP